MSQTACMKTHEMRREGEEVGLKNGRVIEGYIKERKRVGWRRGGV